MGEGTSCRRQYGTEHSLSPRISDFLVERLKKFIWTVCYHQKRYNPTEWLYWGNDWRQSLTDTDWSIFHPSFFLVRGRVIFGRPTEPWSESKVEFRFWEIKTQMQNISKPCGRSRTKIARARQSNSVSRCLFIIVFGSFGICFFGWCFTTKVSFALDPPRTIELW